MTSKRLLTKVGVGLAIGACLLGYAGQAQAEANTFKTPRHFGRLTQTSHAPNDPSGHIVTFIDVPGMTAASVTWKRTKGGSNFDMEAGTGVDGGIWQRATITGQIASASGAGDKVKVLVIPPVPLARRVYINFYVVENQVCEFAHSYSSSHIPTQFIQAAAR